MRRLFGRAAAFALGLSTAVAQTDPGQVAFSLEREGRLPEAEAAWSAIAKQYPTNPEPLAHMGLIESRQGHYAEAIKFYTRAMALNPRMPGLQLNLGLAFFKAGDYKRAIAELDPMLKAQPDNQQLVVLIGMSHYGLEQFSQASPLLKQASDRDPANLTLLLTLAHSCLLSHQYPCVVDAYHRLVTLNAESAEADMLVGEALDEMKDPVGAIREFPRCSCGESEGAQCALRTRLSVVDEGSISGGSTRISRRKSLMIRTTPWQRFTLQMQRCK